MSTIVSGDGWTADSSDESAEDMVAALTPDEPEDDTPRVISNKGKKAEGAEPKPKDKLSRAASELGKRGGQAAARARREKADGDDRDEAESGPAKGARGRAAEKDDEDEGQERPARGRDEEDDEPEAEEDRPDRRGNPRHDPRARVMQATREAKEAREQAAAREAENRELRGRLERLERAAQAPPQDGGRGQERTAQGGQDDDPEPQEEDFPDYKSFVKATAQWEYRQAARQDHVRQRAHQAASVHAQRIQGSIDGYRTELSKATEADPDFMEKVRPLTDWLEPSFTLPRDAPRSARNWIADDLMSAPGTAPALLLYLQEHPKDLQRIAALRSPRAVTRELAKLEARLDAATADTSSEREVSKAKPPVRSVTGSPRTADDQPDDDDDYDTHVRKMNAQEKRRGRR